MLNYINGVREIKAAEFATNGMPAFASLVFLVNGEHGFGKSCQRSLRELVQCIY